MRPAVHLLPGRETRPELYRWGFSLAIVLLAHVVATAGFLRWDSFAVPPDPQLASAVMVDLAPAPIAPEEPAITPPDPEPEPPPPEPEPVHEVEPPAPQALLPPPVPESEPEHDRVYDTPAEAVPEPAAPPGEAVAGVAAPENVDPVQTWQARLLARLELYKRYPRQALLRRQEGVVYLRFVLDRTGKVVECRLEHSSGNASLDQESLAMLQRAQPLPPPPPEIPHTLIPLVVPVQFYLPR